MKQRYDTKRDMEDIDCKPIVIPTDRPVTGIQHTNSTYYGGHGKFSRYFLVSLVRSSGVDSISK